MFFYWGVCGGWRCVSFSDRKKSGKPLLMGASGASALAVVAQQCATIPSPTTSQTVNVPSPYSFAVPSVVSWRRLTIFPSSPPFFDVELMGRKGREINRGFSSPTSAPLPVTAGQVSAGGELPRRETERQRWVRKMRVAVGVRMRERACCMGAERASERAAQPKGAHLQQTKDQFSPFHSQLLITSKSSTGPAAVSPLKRAVHTCAYTQIRVAPSQDRT